MRVLIYLLLIVNVWAEENVYLSKDKNGQIVVGNVNKDGQKMILPPLNIYAMPMTKNDMYTRGLTFSPQLLNNKTNDDSKYFSTQKNLTRHMILANELEKEKIACTNSLTLLKTGGNIKYLHEDSKSYNERIKVLQDSVTEHTKNIEILQKELNN